LAAAFDGRLEWAIGVLEILTSDLLTLFDNLIFGAPMKYWEIVADNLKKAGWSRGYVSALDPGGRTIWIADAHRDNGKRFVMRSDEKLTAFLELERVTRESLRFPNAE
jgi:hypothetical protein